MAIKEDKPMLVGHAVKKANGAAAGSARSG